MARDVVPDTKPVLLFVNKTIGSHNLSRSHGFEKQRIFRHVQPRVKNRNSLKGSKNRAVATFPRKIRDQKDGDKQQDDSEDDNQRSPGCQQNQSSALPILVASADGREQSTVPNPLTNCNEQLSLQLMVLLGGSKTPSRWITYIPSYIDGEQTLALAATAVLHARKAQLCGDPAEGSLASRYYRKCLSLLRTSITASGGCLLTIALLALYEQTALTALYAWAAHVSAMGALLLEGGRSECLGELAPVFLYMTKGHRYLMPLATGSASPFQRKLWLDLEPVLYPGMNEDIKRLKSLSNRIFILLPRLVAGIRASRNADKFSFGAVDGITELLRLAAHLQRLKDPIAESAALFNITLETTTNVEDAKLVPFSYASTNFETLIAVSVYWEARLAVANVCRVLLTLVEKVAPDFLWQCNPSDIELRITKDQEQLPVHILMCLQSFGGVASAYIAFSSGLLAVWRAISDLDGICGLDAVAARAWLLSKFANKLGVPNGRCELQVIDETCEMMVGGPLKGFWVDAFQGIKGVKQRD